MEIFTNLFLIAFSLFLLFFITKKFDLKEQGWNIIIFTTLYSVVVKLIRSFRSVYAKEILGNQDLVIIGINLGIASVAIAGVYGLVSIFVRFPFGIIYGKMKKKFTLFRIVVFMLLVTSFLVGFVNPQSDNYGLWMWLSALSVGLGASIWGFLNVALNSQMKKSAFVAVSILSISPLLAEYIAAPFQYLAKAHFGLVFLWQMSFVFAIIAFVYSFFIKENKVDYKISKKVFFTLIKDLKFWMISSLGILVLLFKFATAGNVATFYLSSLTDNAFLISYVDVVFSLCQLIAGVYLGVKLVDKLDKWWILALGLSMFFAFTFINSLVVNPWVFFFTYTLHGAGYGICYNLLMALVLQEYDIKTHPTLMGLYQSLLAIGIYFGSTFGISRIIQNDFSNFLKIISFLIAIIVIIIVLLNTHYNKRKKNEV